MRKKYIAVFGLIVLFIIPGIVSRAQTTTGGADPQDAKELGREYTKLFYEGAFGTVWSKFDAAMQKVLGSEDNLKAFRGQVNQQLGDESSVESEEVASVSSARIYTRLARFKRVPDLIEVAWTMDEKGTVLGFYIRPAQKEAETQYLEYKTKTDLRVPFDGAWYVFWGGRTISQNYHAKVVDQRFALDIIMMKDGSSHAGDGLTNDQYHCFSKPIFAPGSGVIAAAVDGIEDNVPGVMNARQPVGNHVVIDHGNGEFSFLAHFKKGSLNVKEGQRIAPGELLGLCGNSGNSSEPHLHFHLQTTAVYSKGEGLPAQFQNYVADGKPVDRGEPVKGQTIERRSDSRP